MTTLISILLICGLTALLASAASGIGAILLGVGRQTLATSGPATTALGGGGPPLLRRAPRIGLVVALGLLLIALVVRAVLIGHAPWSTLHEFSLAFAAALIGTHLVLGRTHPLDGLAPFTALLAGGLVAFSLGLDDSVDPLVPALQQPLLLTVHVGAAVLAYAVSGVAFLAAAAEIGQARSGDRIPLLPSAAAARAVGHRAVLIAFPILTIAIALGSVWANLAWRSYWSNDPKELAAAATWLVFGAYLHVAGRRDRWERLAPWLIVLGFAGVLFTYVGAGLFFIGEHSYAGPMRPPSLRAVLAVTVLLASAACATDGVPTDEPLQSVSFEDVPVAAAREMPPSGPFVEGRIGPTGGTIFDPSSAALEPAVAYRFSLGHCGLHSPVDVDGSFWDAIDGVTPDGRPLDLGTDSEMINATAGVVVVIGDEARFRTDSGSVVRFARHEGDKEFPGCM